ncbi:MAG TPA: hypothetical protein VGG74_37335 [Kofleriaceae bacterium]
MEPPFKLPAGEADLAEWAVYGDWLLTKGDPMGELIAHELALPAIADREPLAEFHRLAARSCKERQHSLTAWCLGHVRTLSLVTRARIKLSRGREPIEHGLLANVHQQLLGHAARLEELGCHYVPGSEPKAWRRLFAALPPTCRRVAVKLLGSWTAGAVDELVGWLPSTVCELAIEPSELSRGSRGLVAQFVTDRFALVELDRCDPDSAAPDQLAEALAATRTVRLRVRDVDLARRLAPDRHEVGSSRAAGLVTDGGRIAVLEPWSLEELQSRYGVIPVRAQIARLLPEGYSLSSLQGSPRASPWGTHLVRRGTQWTIRSSDDFRVWQHGEPLAAITELHDGDEVEIQDGYSTARVRCRFVANLRDG